MIYVLIWVVAGIMALGVGGFCTAALVVSVMETRKAKAKRRRNRQPPVPRVW